MYNIDTVKKYSLKGVDKMKKIPGVDMEKAADLEILAEKLVMVPKEELIYISGRVDSYADMQKREKISPGNEKEAGWKIEDKQKKSSCWFGAGANRIITKISSLLMDH